MSSRLRVAGSSTSSSVTRWRSSASPSSFTRGKIAQPAGAEATLSGCGGHGDAGGQDDRTERARIGDGELGEDLAIDLDARPGHRADQLAVRRAVDARARVDADDPQPTHVPLLVLATAVRVHPRAV